MIYSEDREYHIHLKNGDPGRYVILVGDPGRCEEVAAHFDDARKIAQNREYTTYTGTLNGERISVTSTGIGGPSAAIAVEELIHTGADTFIRVGTSGGIDPSVLGGDVVIATGSIRQDSTPNEYAPIEFPAIADFQVVSALKGAAEALGKRCHLGVIQCKDAFYGQHSPEDMAVAGELKYKWEAWLRMGALASEMESSTLFIVSQLRRARAGTVLLCVANQTRRAMGLEDIQCHDTAAAITVGVEAMRTLIKEDRAKNART